MRITDYTPLQIAEMAEWLTEQTFTDIDPEFIKCECSDPVIVSAINRHYHGGVSQFIADGSY